MKKVLSAFLAVLTIAGSLFVAAPQANADGGRITAGVLGGLAAGALVGGALASRPAYVAPGPTYVAPAPVYVEEPACRIVRERYWDEYGGVWRSRRVRVCD